MTRKSPPARLAPSALLATLLATLLAAFLGGCLGGDDGNPHGTEVENELKGILRFADGRPAPGAKVRLYPVDFRPVQEASDTAEPYSAVTDQDGVYRIRDVRQGEYNVLGDLLERVSYRDSVGITAGTDSLPTDTLRAPGSITGYVALQPNHLPATATVEILGTRYFANVDDSGAFRFASLAAGRYSIRVSTTLPDYTPLFTGFAARDGRSDTLADTLRPAYTGIPVVTGLRATYDTLRSVVRLAWNPVRYRNLEDYLVYRDPADRLIPSSLAIGSSRDTVYFDTLAGPSQPPASLAQRYRVRVRNKSDQVGLSFGNLEVATPPPGEVVTSATLRLARFAWSSALQADSVVVIASLGNPTRGLDSLAWSIGPKDSLVSRRGLGKARQADDTLRFLWPHQGAIPVRIRVWDESGLERQESHLVPGNSAPTLRKGILPDTLLAGVPFRWQPEATDPDGDRLRFTAANLPAWATFDTATGLVQGTPANSHTGDHAGLVVDVTDGRRKATLAPVRLTVKKYPWVSRSMPASIESHVACRYGDLILVIAEGRKNIVQEGDVHGTLEPGWQIHAYDPAADAWKEMGFIQSRNIYPHFSSGNLGIHTAYAWGDRVVLLVGSYEHHRPFVLDPATGRAEPRTPSAYPRRSFMTAAAGGKLYVMGGIHQSDYQVRMEAYDPATDAWSDRSSTPYTVHDAWAVPLDGEILLFGGRYGGDIPDSSALYSPVTDTWKIRKRIGIKLKGWGFRGCAAGGKAYAYAGMAPGPTPDRPEVLSRLLQRFDPAANAWTQVTGSSLNRDSRPASCVEWGGKLHFFGGAYLGGFTEVVHHRILEIYDPAMDTP